MPPGSTPPLILFGAFDRHNLGDLQFAHIAACRAPRPVILAGLVERDLTPWGGHRVRAVAEVARTWGEAPADVLHVGGEILTWLTRTVDNWGNIASIGLAASHKLETTVMPFILRGVSLLGINSSAMTRDVRVGIWKRLATDLKPRHLDRIVTDTIPFDELPSAFGEFVKGRIMGRTVVKIA